MVDPSLSPVAPDGATPSLPVLSVSSRRYGLEVQAVAVLAAAVRKAELLLSDDRPQEARLILSEAVAAHDAHQARSLDALQDELLAIKAYVEAPRTDSPPSPLMRAGSFEMPSMPTMPTGVSADGDGPRPVIDKAALFHVLRDGQPCAEFRREAQAREWRDYMILTADGHEYGPIIRPGTPDTVCDLCGWHYGCHGAGCEPLAVRS